MFPKKNKKKKINLYDSFILAQVNNFDPWVRRHRLLLLWLQVKVRRSELDILQSEIWKRCCWWTQLSACSSFDETLLPFLTCRRFWDVNLPCLFPWFKHTLIQFVLEHTVTVRLLRPVFSPSSCTDCQQWEVLSSLNRRASFCLSPIWCRKPWSTSYRHNNQHSLVEWLHNCYYIRIFGSQYLNPVFKETVLSIACSNLRKKNTFGKNHLDVLKILIFAFSDVSICRLITYLHWALINWYLIKYWLKWSYSLLSNAILGGYLLYEDTAPLYTVF